MEKGYNLHKILMIVASIIISLRTGTKYQCYSVSLVYWRLRLL
jgi:hypothetical protein